MSFSVSASRDTSSPTGGTGSLLGSPGFTASARRRRVSTGRSAPAASAYPPRDAAKQREREEDEELVAQVVERLVARPERAREDGDAVP